MESSSASSLSRAPGMLRSICHIGYVLKAWKDAIASQDERLPVIYDETVDFQRANKAIKKNRTARGEDIYNDLPLLAFSRGPLQWDNDRGTGLRSRTSHIICTDENGQNIKLKTIQAYFDITFIYFSRTIEDISRFEIAYMSEDFISNFKKLQVTLPYGIKSNYNFVYDTPFDDKILETENNEVKGISGSVRVSGQFFNIQGAAKLIEKVNFKIDSFDAVDSQGNPIGTVNLSNIIIQGN